MPFINWIDDYSVGIKSIDAQHKKLFDILNNLHNSMKMGRSKEIISDLVNQLADYTVYHFSLEENNMIRTKFAGYLLHKEEHDIFAKKIREFQSSYNLHSAIVSIELLQFLKDWLTEHVFGTDKNYSYHFIKNKVI